MEMLKLPLETNESPLAQSRPKRPQMSPAYTSCTSCMYVCVCVCVCACVSVCLCVSVYMYTCFREA